ncbi:MAG: hypothetical protein WD894_18575 [Pirellulales bacterium]
MIARHKYTAEELVKQAELLTAAGQEAVREALLFHKRNGNSIAVWRDGRVVIVPAEEIVVDPPTSNSDPASPSS